MAKKVKMRKCDSCDKPATNFAIPLGNPDEPALCDECFQKLRDASALHLAQSDNKWRSQKISEKYRLCPLKFNTKTLSEYGEVIWSDELYECKCEEGACQFWVDAPTKLIKRPIDGRCAIAVLAMSAQKHQILAEAAMIHKSLSIRPIRTKGA